MGEGVQNYESSNINALWLQNIYENIKKMEEHSRLAMEGCDSLFSYLQIPYEQRAFILGDTQLKNLRFLVTEFKLLLDDLSPEGIIAGENLKHYYDALENVSKALENRKLFLKEPKGVRDNIKYSAVTPFFWETYNVLTFLKRNLIKDIGHILFIKETEKPKTW